MNPTTSDPSATIPPAPGSAPGPGAAPHPGPGAVPDPQPGTALPARPDHPLVSYGLYPLLAAITAAGIAVALGPATRNALPRNAVVGLVTVVTIAVALAAERRHPLRERWQMTRASLVERDLPFIGLGFVVDQVAQTAVALLAAATIPAGGFGPAARLPTAVQAVLALVVFDLFWYGYHRAAHRYERLWRVHGLHHAPSQVYMLVHPVFHPIDLVVSRFVLALLAFRLTGVAPDAAFVAILVLNLQQTVSHTNVDLRVGPLNYLMIGAQTHRFHHSAVDTGNFSSALALWDQVFGTFVHRPREVPARLGLTRPGDYPDPPAVPHRARLAATALRHRGLNPGRQDRNGPAPVSGARPGQDGPGRARTGQDGPGRPRTAQDGLRRGRVGAGWSGPSAW